MSQPLIVDVFTDDKFARKELDPNRFEYKQGAPVTAFTYIASNRSDRFFVIPNTVSSAIPLHRILNAIEVSLIQRRLILLHEAIRVEAWFPFNSKAAHHRWRMNVYSHIRHRYLYAISSRMVMGIDPALPISSA